MQEKKISKSNYFQIKDSFTILAITCAVGIFFAVLLCYYPGKEYLGNDFWPLFALPALLALGCGTKILMNKSIVRIDTNGINFFRSKIFIAWAQVQSVRVLELNEGTDDAEDYLVVKYIDHTKKELLQIDFLITGAMNKTPEDLKQAINNFMP